MSNDISYGQLEDALLALGFEKRAGTGKGFHFTHPASDAVVNLPRYDRQKLALERHLVVTAFILDQYEYMDESKFRPFVRSQGRVAS